jgi:ribosomal protein L37AE/L43A
MAEQCLIRTQDRNIKNGEDLSAKESPVMESLKEGEECPNCHFARLLREDNQILCPVCGYGRKACT